MGWAHQSCCHHCAAGCHIGICDAVHGDVPQEAARYIFVWCVLPILAGLGPTEGDREHLVPPGRWLGSHTAPGVSSLAAIVPRIKKFDF